MPNYLQYPQYYGTPFYVNAKSGKPVNNNGGTVLGVSLASLQNTRLFDTDFGYPYLGQHNQYNDNKPYATTSAQKAIFVANNAGIFASMTQDKYIMLGFTSVIAGLANTLLNSPGLAYGGHSQNINFTGYVNTWRKAQTGGWYYQNGKPVNPQFSRDKVSSEVQTTYANPGRISYLQGALTPLTKSYQAKTD